MIPARLLILILCLRMTEQPICKKHIQNSLFPNYAAVPNYDIREWVVNLNLQICTIVEVGEYYSALFLEDHNSEEPFNFYLGMCDHQTMKNWHLCAPDLAMQRKNVCNIDVEHTEDSRVHRRFCDIHYITLTQPPCNCSNVMDTPLYKVNGFPTCFIDPLPDSLCGPLNVCGLHKCNASTVLDRIHSVRCDPTCRGHQPFCEWPTNLRTTQPPMVYSLWSDWYELEKKDDRTTDTQILYYEAKCVNKYTYKGGLDCLGPGTSCCPPDIIQCKCKTFVEDATLKVRRWVVIAIEQSTMRSKDYDLADDFARKEIGVLKKHRRFQLITNLSLSKRESQFYEDDDEDGDIDEDITIDEERTPKMAVLKPEEEKEENDEGTCDDSKEIIGDSTLKKGKIVPNKKGDSTKIIISENIMFYVLAFGFVFWY